MNKHFVKLKINNKNFFFLKKINFKNIIWLFGKKGFFIVSFKHIYIIKKKLFLNFFYKKFNILNTLFRNLKFLLLCLVFNLSSYIQIWGKGFKFEYYLSNLHVKFGFSNLLFYNLFFFQINYKIWLRSRILFLEFKNKVLLMKFFFLLENLKYRDFYTGRGIFLKNRFFFLKKSQKLYI